MKFIPVLNVLIRMYGFSVLSGQALIIPEETLMMKIISPTLGQEELFRCFLNLLETAGTSTNCL